MLGSISHFPQTFVTRKPANDGKVDAQALEGFSNPETLVTDIQDERLAAVLQGKLKKDASPLGQEWKASFHGGQPIYSNRGIIGLNEQSDYETEGQNVHVDWYKKTVTVRTEAPGASEGHQIQASIDWQRNLVADSVTESTYLIAEQR